MANLNPSTLSATLGQYQHQGFRLIELDDHIVILEHTPCGFQDKFSATGVTIEAIRNDCKDHLTRCAKNQDSLLGRLDRAWGMHEEEL